MMHKTQLMECMSIHFVTSVVAAAGYSFNPPRPDFGHDGHVHRFETFQGILVPTMPELAIQIKSTSNLGMDDLHVRYRIDARTHTILTHRPAEKKILVVVDLPSEVDNWIQVKEGCLEIYRSAYWIHGRELPSLPSGQESMTIRIPRDRLFSVWSLKQIIDNQTTSSPEFSSVDASQGAND